jgi:hypothetical protein
MMIILQLIGFAAAALLASYAIRLRRPYPAAAWTGVVTAVLACTPGIVTVILALVADTASPTTIARWSVIEATADDLLFVGVAAFAIAVAAQLRPHPVTRGSLAETPQSSAGYGDCAGQQE